MAKERPVEISVATIFDGKQDGRQAFIDLILYKRRAADLGKNRVDCPPKKLYNDSKVFSDVHVG